MWAMSWNMQTPRTIWREPSHKELPVILCRRGDFSGWDLNFRLLFTVCALLGVWIIINLIVSVDLSVSVNLSVCARSPGFFQVSFFCHHRVKNLLSFVPHLMPFPREKIINELTCQVVQTSKRRRIFMLHLPYLPKKSTIKFWNCGA